MDASIAINLKFEHVESALEYKQVPAPPPQRNQKRGKTPIEHDSVPYLTRQLNAFATTTYPPSIPIPPTVPSTPVQVSISVERNPVYITGRYCKYERGLSQTPWEVEGVKLAEFSVQDLIALPLEKPWFNAESVLFHSAGREDVDVRMLGNGRPFVLQFQNAKRGVFTPEEFKAMEEAVNTSTSGVSVHNLGPCTKDVFQVMKDGAEAKKKTYCCVVITSRDITQADLDKLEKIKELQIDQVTPIRVLHRRTLMNRKKIIHSFRCEYTNSRSFLMYIETSAGTYVKEFVHGDLGRTSPNVGSLLGCSADILQLDVTNLTEDFTKEK